MNFIDVIATIFTSLGAFFLLVGSIGLIRLPDFYSRAHAQGKADTLGMILIIFGLLIVEFTRYFSQFEEKFIINALKLIILLGFVGLTNPTATNALVRAAHRFRLKPWFKADQKKKDPDKKEEK